MQHGSRKDIQTYQTVATTSTAIQRGRATAFEFTVPPHVPVDRVAFNPGREPAMFSRDVSVTVTPLKRPAPADAAEPPQTIASGNLLRLHTERDGHRIDEEHLAIDALATGFDSDASWVVTIENGDDPPLALQSVSLEMMDRKFCFEAGAETRYSLSYGDSALTAPSYDYATLFAPQADALQAVLGPEQENTAYQPRPDERPFSERHPALLWVTLVMVIALLAAIAIRSAGKSDKFRPSH